MTTRLLLVLSVAGLGGCVSAQATLLTPNRYAPVPEQEVRVYLAASELPAECVRIALIHAQGNVDWTNEQQMINAARRRAAKVGANAVVLDTIRDPSTGTRVAAEVFGLPVDRKGEMVGYRCPASAAASASDYALQGD